MQDARLEFHIRCLWFAGFALPPSLWLAGNWYMGLWSGPETLRILANPVQAAYVVVFLSLAYRLNLRRHIHRVRSFSARSDAAEKTAAQRAAAPWRI